MKKELHDKLVAKTNTLIKRLSEYSTEPILGFCANEFTLDSTNKENKFYSKQKQIFYLIALMLKTKEPNKAKVLTERNWNELISLSNEIFSIYSWMFYPTNDERPLTENWHKIREVSMPAFLHYFNMGILASVEQIKQRINFYLIPFEKIISSEIGITITEIVEVIDFICTSIQNNINNLTNAFDIEQNVRTELLDEADEKDWSIERIRKEVQTEKYLPFIKNLMDCLNNLYKIKKSHLIEKFGEEKSELFWNLFCSKRGKSYSYFYMTENNFVEKQPLILLDANTAAFLNANNLYNAALLVGEDILVNSTYKDSYYRKRDEVLVDEGINLFKKLFPVDTTIHTNLYESKLLQYEHDIIIVWQHKLFIIEAKASPPPEPFRDPDKAYNRIKRKFKSDKGIQKAYEQCIRLYRKWKKHETINLFNKKQDLVLSIKPNELEQVYCVCLTKDNFGPTAFDLSLLLEKKDDDPYPWATDIYDLENLIDAWNYFSWGPSKLCNYLEERIQVHGKVFISDELEIAGFYIEHGSLKWIINSDKDKMFLNSQYSNVFDKIYRAINQNGKEVIYSPKEPHFTDTNEIIQEIIKEKNISNNLFNKSQTRKIGRNALCPCGSGKKYKKCCLNK